MIHKRFDDLARSLSNRPSRRHLLAGLSGSLLASSTARFPQVINAKRKRKRKKRKKQKVVFNVFGCVNVDSFCQGSAQCCSGICEGKKGKKTCRAHDGGSGCQAGQAEGCAGVSGSCMTSTGLKGGCDTTTGNAGYCGYGFACADCHKDADCQELCGLAAAVCITCPDCDGTSTFQTACVGPGPINCP